MTSRPVRVLLASASRGARTSLVLAILIGVLVRLAVLATAREVTQNALRDAAIVSIVVGAALALQRILQARLRVTVECDLHRAATKALVEGDVLEPPGTDLQRTVFEGEGRARLLLGTTLPQLVSDAVVCVFVLPYLAFVLPSRILGIAGAALFAVLVSVVALRRATRLTSEHMLAASQDVYDQVLIGIEGRLEVAARGGEAELAARVEEALGRYARIASAAGIRSALAGRAPIAAGAAIIGVAIALDPASRGAVGTAVLGDLLLLAACLPPIMGVAINAQELVRARALLAPLIALLVALPRSELTRGGVPLPKAPLSVVLEHVSFRYGPCAHPVLSDVNAEWRPGTALTLSGANGAGKSTLLRLLLGLRAPTEGAITISGVRLADLDLIAYRRTASYLPQEPYLGEPHVTVGAALRMAIPNADDQALRAALARVDVLGALERRGSEALAVTLGTLSAGQRQRVALARVIAQDATLVLLDEPDAYLDAAGVALVATLVSELVAAGKMVAVAAHSPELAIAGAVKITLARPSG